MNQNRKKLQNHKNYTKSRQNLKIAKKLKKTSR